MITHIAAAPVTVTKLFWKILCDHFACVLDSLFKPLKAMCPSYLSEKAKQNKSISFSKPPSWFVGQNSKALIVILHCIQPVDFCPVIKPKARGHVPVKYYQTVSVVLSLPFACEAPSFSRCIPFGHSFFWNYFLIPLTFYLKNIYYVLL